jgi:hypothetical protein
MIRPMRLWLNRLFSRAPLGMSRSSTRSATPSRGGRARGRGPAQRFEALETRTVPATITVTSLADNTTTDTLITLREAIQAANTDASVDGSTAGSGADTIVFDASLYAGGDVTVDVSVFDTGLDSSEVGPTAFSISSNVTILGPDGNNGVTITRNSGSNFRLFAVTGAGNLTLDSVTVSNGAAVGFNGGTGRQSGGGGAGLGGGVFVNSGGSLTIRNSLLTGNTAVGGSGGSTGGYFQAGGGGGGLGANGNAGSNFSSGGAGGGPNNGAANGGAGGFGGGGGGGRYSFFPGASGGSGGFGGGGGGGGITYLNIFTYLSNPGGAGGFGGGGGGGSSGGVSGFGGGSGQSGYFAGGGHGAGMGGAVFSNGGTVTITNSTLTGNSAEGKTSGASTQHSAGLGGAVFSRNGSVEVLNSTISANTVSGSSSSTARGIYVLGDGSAAAATLNNALLGEATSSTVDVVAATINSGTKTTTGAGNLIQSQVGLSGVTIVSTANPDLGSLADNGGPTRTLALNTGSPAINAGSNSAVTGLSYDQRGSAYDRVDFGTVDIGAYEVQNAVPVAQFSQVTTSEDTAITFAVSDFEFTDDESDSLVSITVSSLALATDDTLTVDQGAGAITVTTGMTITASQIPSLTYTPAANANGGARSSFDFTVNDGGSGISDAQMILHVTAVNDAPVALTSQVTTNEDTAKTFSASDFSFSDVESNSLGSITVSSLSLATGDTLTVNLGAGPVTVTSGMTILATQLTSLRYTPLANANGSARSSFTFTVNDDDSGTVGATLTIHVSAVNDGPAAQASQVTTNEDTAKTFSAADFPFTDLESNSLVSITVSSLLLASGDTLKVNQGAGLVSVTNGMTITTAQIPSLTYTPAANVNGSNRSSFQFRVNDASNGSVVATMTLHVTPVNDPPVALASSVNLNEDSSKVFSTADFLFTDVESNPLVSITVSGLALASGDTLTVNQGAGVISVTNGMTITAAQVPSLTYTPAADANGSARGSFQFRVNDVSSGTVAATLAIHVTPVEDVPANTPPVAIASGVIATEDTPRAFRLADFQYADADQDALVSITVGPLNLATGDTLKVNLGAGTVAVTNGMTIPAARIPSLTYTPAANANGTVRSSFQFRVNDAASGTEAATMTLHVAPANDAPTDLQLSPLQVAEKLPVGTLVGAFRTTDVDTGEAFTYTLVAGTGDSGNAKFSISGNQLLMAAVLNFADQATVSIRVRATDRAGLSFEQSLTLVVNSTAQPVRNFRAYNPRTDSHFFTTSRAEFENAIRNGFRDESTSRAGFEVLSDAAPNSTPIYRLYNIQTGQHYYTTDRAERDFLVAIVPPPATGPDTRTMGWRFERADGFIYPSGQTGTTAIYRLYNRNSGVHLFTESSAVRDAVLAIPGSNGGAPPWELHATFGFGIPVGSTSPAATSPASQAVIEPTVAETLPTNVPAAPSVGIFWEGTVQTSSAPAVAPATVDLGLIVQADPSTRPAPQSNLPASGSATISTVPRLASATPFTLSPVALDLALGQWTDALEADDLSVSGLGSGRSS